MSPHPLHLLAESMCRYKVSKYRQDLMQRRLFEPVGKVSVLNEDLGCLDDNSESYLFPGWFSLS